jgi:protein subunit release factor B
MTRKFLFSVTKKDLDIQTFTTGGPGGQNQNRIRNGIRITHKESGAVGEARDTRSQHANKKAAFERMAKSPKFQFWLKQKARDLMNKKTIDEIVEEQLDSKFIQFEVKDDKGRWIIYEGE